MKKFLSPHQIPLLTDIYLLLLRIGVGIALLTHGYPKLQMLLGGGEIMFLDPLGIGAKFSLILVVIAEFLCAIFIILGLLTRFSALVIVINFFVAVVIFHSADPFAGKELAFLFLLFAGLFLFIGPGRFSLDELLFCRNCSTATTEE